MKSSHHYDAPFQKVLWFRDRLIEVIRQKQVLDTFASEDFAKDAFEITFKKEKTERWRR